MTFGCWWGYPPWNSQRVYIPLKINALKLKFPCGNFQGEKTKKGSNLETTTETYRAYYIYIYIYKSPTLNSLWILRTTWSVYRGGVILLQVSPYEYYTRCLIHWGESSTSCLKKVRRFFLVVLDYLTMQCFPGLVDHPNTPPSGTHPVETWGFRQRHLLGTFWSWWDMGGWLFFGWGKKLTPPEI